MQLQHTPTLPGTNHLGALSSLHTAVFLCKEVPHSCYQQYVEGLRVSDMQGTLQPGISHHMSLYAISKAMSARYVVSDSCSNDAAECTDPGQQAVNAPSSQDLYCPKLFIDPRKLAKQYSPQGQQTGANMPKLPTETGQSLCRGSTAQNSLL